MKCADVIEFGQQCSIRDALQPCPDYDEKTEDCLRHKRELEKLNKRYGCIIVFVKKEETPHERV